MDAEKTNVMVSSGTESTKGKPTMVSMFSGLDLALDANGAVISNVFSAAKDLLVTKNAEKELEAQLAASYACKKELQQKERKNPPITALTQALELFDQEMDERNAFMSRHTKRRLKGGKKSRGGILTPSRGRRLRYEKYKRV